MKNKTAGLLKNKSKTIPILASPAAKLMNISVKELLSSSELQAKGMTEIAKSCNIGAVLNMMDLSVEAEAFGARIRFYDNDVPTVEKGIIADIEEADSIIVPEIGCGRTGICIDAIKKVKESIKDIPVFCGAIGPFSLAGRLFDMTELMIECFDSPEAVKTLLSKTTQFITSYINVLKRAGADGIILAEPAAGLLSPSLAEDFSTPFVQEIFEAVNDEDFIICYHNCGSSVGAMLDMISALNADIIHLGNSVSMKKALEILPKEKIVMGNIDPVFFRTKSPDDIRNEIERLYSECSEYDNFMISTGCDIPAASSWENINAYFEKITELYN